MWLKKSSQSHFCKKLKTKWLTVETTSTSFFSTVSISPPTGYADSTRGELNCFLGVQRMARNETCNSYKTTHLLGIATSIFVRTDPGWKYLNIWQYQLTTADYVPYNAENFGRGKMARKTRCWNQTSNLTCRKDYRKCPPAYVHSCPRPWARSVGHSIPTSTNHRISVHNEVMYKSCHSDQGLTSFAWCKRQSSRVQPSYAQLYSSTISKEHSRFYTLVHFHQRFAFFRQTARKTSVQWKILEILLFYRTLYSANSTCCCFLQCLLPFEMIYMGCQNWLCWFLLPTQTVF